MKTRKPNSRPEPSQRHQEPFSPSAEAELAAKKEAYNKVIKDRNRIQYLIEHRNRQTALKNMTGIKTLAQPWFPISPKGWAEFSILGKSLDAVPPVPRFFIFVAASPFKLVGWALGSVTRFFARRIAVSQTKNDFFNAEAARIAGEKKVDIRTARKQVKAEWAANDQKIKGSGFKKAIEPSAWAKGQKEYDIAVEATRKKN